MLLTKLFQREGSHNLFNTLLLPIISVDCYLFFGFKKAPEINKRFWINTEDKRYWINKRFSWFISYLINLLEQRTKCRKLAKFLITGLLWRWKKLWIWFEVVIELLYLPQSFHFNAFLCSTQKDSERLWQPSSWY